MEAWPPETAEYSHTAAFAKTKSAQEAVPAVHQHHTPTCPSLLLCLLSCSASLAICRMLPLGAGCAQDRFLPWFIIAPTDLKKIWCPTAPFPCRSCGLAQPSYPPCTAMVPLSPSWCPKHKGKVSEHSDHIAQDQFSQSPQLYRDL